MVAKTAPKVEEEEDDELEAEALVDQPWEFIDAVPTTDQVMTLLNRLPELYGIKHADFIEFVQPLSQRKNFKASKQDPDDYHIVWNLYFTVAGRLSMLNAAAQKNGWKVDFVPEPTTPTGIPGYLTHSEADGIVYREYVQVIAAGEPLGNRPGTARVPWSGGAGAVGTNRYEKLETAARGRALGAWGFGVLPGSGIASLEEMQSSREVAREVKFDPARKQQGNQQREQRPRADVESSLRLILGEYQELTSLSDDAMFGKVGAFVARSFNKEVGMSEAGAPLFAELKDGELVLLERKMQQEVTKVRAESEPM